MIDSIVNLLLAALVALICLGAGRQVLSRLGFRTTSLSEGAVLGAGVGFGALVYVMALLGVAGAYRPVTAWGLLLALGIVGAWGLRTWPWQVNLRGLTKRLRGVRLSWPAALLIAVLLLYGLGYLIAALAPTLEGDSIAGYLVTAREYARQGGIVSVDYAYSDSYPANGQMLSTFGFLLHGQILAQLLLVWLMGVLALGVIYAFGKQWLPTVAVLVAIAAWYAMYSVGYLATSAKIDLAWAAFELLALLAFSRWYFVKAESRHWRWLVLTGFFLGLAGGTKQASIFVGITLTLAVAVRLWQDYRGKPWSWAGAYLALGVPTAVAGLWVLRSYLTAGELAFTGSELRGDSGVLGFFRTLWNMSMLGNAPSVEGPLGKSIGPTVLASVPFLIVFRNVDRRAWHILVFCGLVLVMWYLGVQRARHLLPTLGLLSLLAGYAVALLLAHRRLLGQAVLLLIVISLAVNLATWSYIHLASSQKVPYVVGLQDRDAYLAANLPKLPWYPNHAVLAYTQEHLPNDARIAALSSSNGYYLERPLYAGWSQTPENIPDSDAFASRLKTAGITHVFTNDYVIKIRGMENAWLAQPAFQARYLRELVCADGQCLYALR